MVLLVPKIYFLSANNTKMKNIPLIFYYISEVAITVQNFKKLLSVIKFKSYFLMLGHKFVKTYLLISQKLWDRIGEIGESKTKEILYKYKLN